MLATPPVIVLFLFVGGSLAQVLVLPVRFLLPPVIVALFGCNRMIILVIGIVIGPAISTAGDQCGHEQCYLQEMI